MHAITVAYHTSEQLTADSEAAAEAAFFLECVTDPGSSEYPVTRSTCVGSLGADSRYTPPSNMTFFARSAASLASCLVIVLHAACALPAGEHLPRLVARSATQDGGQVTPLEPAAKTPTDLDPIDVAISGHWILQSIQPDDEDDDGSPGRFVGRNLDLRTGDGFQVSTALRMDHGELVGRYSRTELTDRGTGTGVDFDRFAVGVRWLPIGDDGKSEFAARPYAGVGGGLVLVQFDQVYGDFVTGSGELEVGVRLRLLRFEFDVSGTFMLLGYPGEVEAYGAALTVGGGIRF